MSRFNLNLLISNIINENNFAHCRICLKQIVENDYVLLEDRYCLDESKEYYLSMSEILLNLTNDEIICEDIAGIDVVCKTCGDEALKAVQFIQNCKRSHHILHKVLDSVTEKINGAFEFMTDQNLYLQVSDDFHVKVTKTLSRHYTKESVKCNQCNYSFKSALQLKHHNKEIHNVLTCVQCFETFYNLDALNNHTKNKVQCIECNVYKCTEKLLQSHQEKKHTVVACNECGKTFDNITKLKKHNRKEHQKQICPKCGKSYSTLFSYTKHTELCLSNCLDPHPMRSKLSKDFKCQDCGKAYTTQGSLRVHQRFAHIGEKGHECQECGKVFTAPSNLKIHLVTHTKEKNFHCDICKKNFVSKEALVYHIRRHTGEKPYQCTICSEKFVNSSARAEHIKFKHVGPTIQCDMCSRKFVSNHFLNLHRNRHFDRTSKLYIGRSYVPASQPSEENIRNFKFMKN